MMRFSDKVALVTGGRTGIGKAIADRLREEGARVYTVQRSHDPDHDCITADLADPATPGRVVDAINEQAGRLDVLVNNAGVMRQAGIEGTSIDDWSYVLAVNLTAPFLMVRSALAHLRATRGCIVNIGSIEGLGANPGHAAYCATKAGLHGLTRAIAIDHGKDGIRCNAVAPGWIDTQLNEEFIESMEDAAAFRRDIGKIHPAGRTGSPAEIAALVAFLASEEAAFITGEIYRIDGGRMAKLSLPG